MEKRETRWKDAGVKARGLTKQQQEKLCDIFVDLSDKRQREFFTTCVFPFSLLFSYDNALKCRSTFFFVVLALLFYFHEALRGGVAQPDDIFKYSETLFLRKDSQQHRTRLLPLSVLLAP